VPRLSEKGRKRRVEWAGSFVQENETSEFILSWPVGLRWREPIGKQADRFLLGAGPRSEDAVNLRQAKLRSERVDIASELAVQHKVIEECVDSGPE